jgi:hypothetical protein
MFVVFVVVAAVAAATVSASDQCSILDTKVIVILINLLFDNKIEYFRKFK